MTNLERFFAVVAIRSAQTGESPVTVARKTKRTRRKVIVANGEVRS